MTLSTYLDTVIRSAIAKRLQLSRVPPVPQWDDEAAATITGAVERHLKGTARPDGMLTADGPEAASALAGLKERAAMLEDLAGGMLAAFTKGANGWSARVSASQVEEWREKLGEPRA